MAGKASRAEVVAAIKALGSPPGVEKPTFLDPLNLRAAAQLGLGDLKGALKSFEQALELEPNNPTAAKNLATMEWQTGNLERAESVLTSYLQAYPQDESALVKQFCASTAASMAKGETATRMASVTRFSARAPPNVKQRLRPRSKLGLSQR